MLPPERLAELRVEHILTTDTNDLGVLHPLLRMLAERLGRRLRRGGLIARRIRVEIGYADHSEAARTVPLPAGALDSDLWEAARRALTLANKKRIAVRGVTVSMERVEELDGQLELWQGGGAAEQRGSGAGRFADSFPLEPTAPLPRGPAAPLPRRFALQSALDRIHTRYGVRGVARGSQLAARTPPAP